MGISYVDAAFLARAKKNKVSFEKILTIGHQMLYLSQKQIAHLDKFYGLKKNKTIFSNEEYADNFFKVFLGARDVKSLDYSDYEESDIIHDMSKPIDSSYNEMFDAVIDGGSLEHIFNFPVAVENCMKMVKKGGSLFLFSMANNQFGHGFYQFSPELFFRIFQQSNGYKIQDIILVKHPFPGMELSSLIECYSVLDPATVKKRIGLVSKNPVNIIVHAVRTEIVPIFSTYPIQSDYLLTYENINGQSTDTSNKNPLKNLAKKFFSHLPLSYKNYIMGKLQLFAYTFSNKQFYKKEKLF